MATVSQRSLAGGEISPALYGRCDTVKYETGLRIMRNSIIPKHGGAYNRPGTSFVGDATNSSGPVRLIPFRFNDSQTYCLEFSHQLIRFIQNGAYLTLSAQAITALTSPGGLSPNVFTISSHGYATGDQVFLTGVPGIFNNGTFVVNRINSNTFSLTYIDTGNTVGVIFSPSYSGGGFAQKIYTLVSPYSYPDLFNLRFAQQGDIITITNPNYPPKELKRSGSTSWAIASVTIAPDQAPPTSLATSSSGTACFWTVTAIGPNYEESVISNQAGGSYIPTGVAGANFSMGLTWTAAANAIGYNIYRDAYDSYGLVGQVAAGINAFIDTAILPNYQVAPPIATNPFPSANNYPATVAYIKQRIWYGAPNNNPNNVYASRVGCYHNFNVTFPQSAADAITFGVISAQVNTVVNFIDIGNVIVFTDAGEHSALGDANGSITPFSINLKQYSYSGSAGLQPIAIGATALYVQGRGGLVKDLTYDFTVNGYHGNDLTTFANHLFDGFTLIDWAYQKIPNSIVWAVRSDGSLLSLTYIKEQEIWGWSHHDFQNSFVESVCCIPEGTEDSVYLVIRRIINGNTVRYVERLNTRQVPTTGVIDCTFMDASLSYDGRSWSVFDPLVDPIDTLTLSGGTNWTFDEVLTLTSANGLFLSTDVGCSYLLYDPVGAEIGYTPQQGFGKNYQGGAGLRFNITGYTSATTVTGNVTATVPANLQGAGTPFYTRCVNKISGLYHLIGLNVSILGDGAVVASPNNPAYSLITVDVSGSVTLPQAFGVIHVGLPYLSDLETLDIDSPQGETMSDKFKIISRVTVRVQQTSGLFVGTHEPDNYPNETNATQYLVAPKLRKVSAGFGIPTPLVTDTFEINVPTRPNRNGRVFIRQVDPLPMAVVGIHPQGNIPIQGKV